MALSAPTRKDGTWQGTIRQKAGPAGTRGRFR